MRLYSITGAACSDYFGTPDDPIVRVVTVIAQTPSCDAFLLLAKETQDDLELLTLNEKDHGLFNSCFCRYINNCWFGRLHSTNYPWSTFKFLRSFTNAFY